MLQTATATYTPTVLPPAGPTAVNDTSSGDYMQAQFAQAVADDISLTGTAIQGSTLLLQIPGTSDFSTNPVTIANQGTYEIVDGDIRFTPVAGFATTATPVTYQIADSLGRTATATYTPQVSLPAAPTADNETSSGFIGATQTISLVDGDQAAPNTTLDVASVKLCDPTTTPAETSPNCSKTSVSITGVGTYSVDSAGLMTFVPAASFVGTPTALSYTVLDQFNQVATATYTPTVQAAPTASNDTPPVGAFDTDQVISPLANDTISTSTQSPFDNASLKLCSRDNTETGTVEATQTPPNCSLTVLKTADGEYTVNANGTVTFNPDADFTGQATAPVTYQVQDEDGQLVSAVITPSVVTPATADPEASLDSKGKVHSVDLIDGDTSSDSSVPLDRTSVRLSCTVPTNCTVLNNGTKVQIAGVGSYELDEDRPGFATFTPTPTFVGEAPSVTYTVQDANGFASSTYTATVVDMVVIEPDESRGPANAPQSRDVLANDNVGGARLRPETLQLRNPVTREIVQTPTVEVAGEGSYEFSGTEITFNPDFDELISTLLAEPSRQTKIYQEDENGNRVLDSSGQPILERIEASIAPITYQLLDSQGRIVTATYSPVVIFERPVAEPDRSRGPADQPQSQRVLSNDASTGTRLLPNTLQLVTPAQGQTIRANVVRMPNEGTFTFDVADESIRFEPDMDSMVDMLQADLEAHQGNYSNAKLKEVWENGVYLGLEAEVTTITYTVKDEFGFLVTTTYTPRVFFPKPAATPDFSRGAVNEPQRTDVIANDSPSAGIAFEADYLKIWDPANGGSWGITPVETDEGVYTVEAADGVTLQTAGFGGTQRIVLAANISAAGQNSMLVFTPKLNWTGTATPVRYQLRDVFGQKVESTKTPTIEVASVPSPTPAATIVSAINNLAKTGGQPLQFLMALAAGVFTIGMSLKISSNRRRNPVSF
jgi:CshA-type fibril repeat protein